MSKWRALVNDKDSIYIEAESYNKAVANYINNMIGTSQVLLWRDHEWT